MTSSTNRRKKGARPESFRSRASFAGEKPCRPLPAAPYLKNAKSRSFSCTDFPDGEICPGSEVVARVDVGVTSSQEIGGGGRSILPSAFDGGGYEYYLFYIDTLSSSASGYSFYGTVSLSYISQTEATASVEFRPSVYRFVLYACPSHLSSPSENEAKSAAVLSGATIADIRSVRKILFYLDSETLSAKGTVSVDMDSSWAFPTGARP